MKQSSSKNVSQAVLSSGYTKSEIKKFTDHWNKYGMPYPIKPSGQKQERRIKPVSDAAMSAIRAGKKKK